MSRTYKDKSIKYRNVSESSEVVKQEYGLKKRFMNHRRSGPVLDVDMCPDCGGYTDFESGFSCCSECGWVDAGMVTTFFERRSA